MRFRRTFNLNLIAVLHDTFMAGFSFVLALYLRGTWDLFHVRSLHVWEATFGFTVIAVLVFMAMRLYRGLWRYASMQDLITLTKAVSLAIFLFYTLYFLINRLTGLPRSIPAIHWMVLLALLGGPRFAYRIVKDRLIGRHFTLQDDTRIPVLLVGANENTEHFLRETERNPKATYRAVGILDANPRFTGQLMHGVQIYGDIASLPHVVRKLKRRDEAPQRVIVADDAIDGTLMRQLLDMANELGLVLARLPKLTDFRSGTAEKQDIRPVAVEDLLGRAQNAHDKTAMRAMVAGRRVLVTGAGGTIGGELVRQLASFAPAAIILFEQGEFNLYSIDMELSRTYPDLLRRALIADVRDVKQIERIFSEVKPELVFHAAAIKHVPLAEANPVEAMLTNVFGTKNIADACVKHGVAAMVMISTDKAVNPANVMGASKRLAETYAQALGSEEKARGETRFITVRFGNVLGSTGSVVPLFEKQLKAGGPITVTHPDMVRYFMTVREAVELVLHAASMGAREDETRHGLIFVVDMGQPVRIEELAIQMIRLAGLRPHEDIKIVYTGLRPGEKLYEELFHYTEGSLKTDHEGILLASSRRAELKVLESGLTKLYKSCSERDIATSLELLQKFVPEYKPKN